MGFIPKRKKPRLWNSEAMAILKRLLDDGWKKVDLNWNPVKVRSIKISGPEGITEFKNNGHGVFKSSLKLK